MVGIPSSSPTFNKCIILWGFPDSFLIIQFLGAKWLVRQTGLSVWSVYFVSFNLRASSLFSVF